MKALLILTFVISTALSAASVSNDFQFSTPREQAPMSEIYEFSDELLMRGHSCWKDSDCNPGNICCGTGIPPMQEGYCWYQCVQG